MERESKISVPQGLSDSFPIRSRLVPGLVEGRVRVRACPREVGVKTPASDTVAFSLIPILGAFYVGEMPVFPRNGAWEELVIPNALALLLSNPDVQNRCVLLYYVSVSEGSFAQKWLLSGSASHPATRKFDQ